ncbi:COP9 signalosome complex subunit 6-like [Oppia nitens]|uniref:COP9 signalosome complex subunit 6-like n=1 Tax=Oppia nitens TaxID=1686743 RepID=UPI0023DB7F7A|nr:COP9 signalosome complex subunit 6-like [Oppia nitens]
MSKSDADAMDTQESADKVVATEINGCTDQPMDSESPAITSSVMASATVATAAINVSLHPLVIMNVSEHWTRIRAQDSDGVVGSQVIGALIGKQNGRNIEIMNSFELNYDRIESDILIDRDYYNTKESQFKQVFPDLDFLGWYASGDQPNESDLKIHKQIIEINESPLFMKLNPMTRHTGLPLKLYESVIDLVNGKATMLFVDIPYHLATEEAERIGLDHMARMTSTTTQSGQMTNSLVAEHLRVQYSAVKMLRDRVRLILDYIRDIRNESIEWNHEILRETFNLCHRLPVLTTDKFSQDFYNQCNDVALMTYLGMLTKGSNTVNQFVNKFNILYDRQGMGRRMRGLFF